MKKLAKRDTDVHSWRFYRAGGFDQVRLDTGRDLVELEHLDQKLWVALACPVDNVHFDRRTLSMIDTDNDKRVRAAELIAAIKWTTSLLKNPEALIAGKGEISLQEINDATEEGRVVAAAMRRALLALGKSETDILILTDIESLEKVLLQNKFNGDGVITEDATNNESTRAAIREIMAVCGSVNDRSGMLGISSDKAEAFFNQARDYNAWFSESEREKNIRPWGDATDKAALAIVEVREKIDDYFARCAIAAFDDRSMAALNGGEKTFEEIAARQLSLESPEIARLPLARIQPDRSLPLENGLNPAWTDKIRKFKSIAVQPVLGTGDSLSESEWQRLQAFFAPYFAWLARKPSKVLDNCGIAKIRELLGNDMQKTLAALIEQDKAESIVYDSMLSMEKLIRFRRDLYCLCTNFVNFKDFYTKGGTAIFKAGTLYLDQRSCDLCIKVDDMGKHGLMAGMAGAYLVYCECRRHGGGEKMNIVAAFTNGDSDNLIVGRNGIFYDRAGNDWDATIIKILENPISFGQAFWLPYKSLVRMIETQVAKRASAAGTQSSAKLEQTAAVAANADKSSPPAAPSKLDVGIVAALGVAAGALGTFVATAMGFASGIIRLGPLAVIGALAGVLLLISGPSLILASIKLRKRNLGPILDASGWAINAKARINVPFGTALTHVAILPPGSQRDIIDPYAEKKSPWPRLIIMAVIIYAAFATLDHFGFVNEWTNGFIGKKRVVVEKTTGIEKAAERPTPAQ
jgi:hypothetical protein